MALKYCDFSKSYEGSAVPMLGGDIDTDRIIPARFMKEITFDNMGKYCFYDVRFLPDGKKNLDCEFNQEAYKKASVLVVEDNFGCGSSREHAPQALKRFGFDVLIGLSFAEIFSGNCRALGMPTLAVSKLDLARLVAIIKKEPSCLLSISLTEKRIECDGNVFNIISSDQQMRPFIDGSWDALAELKKNKEAIEEVASQLPYFSEFNSL